MRPPDEPDRSPQRAVRIPERSCADYSMEVATEWLAVAGTLGGALLGAGSTMMAEAFRARRARTERIEDTRRQVYVTCLSALTQTDNAMQALAIDHPTPLARGDITAAFRSHQLVAAIYELELVAPKAVCDSAWSAYERLRNIRELLITHSVVIGGTGGGSPEWQAVHEPFLVSLGQLRAGMRGRSVDTV